MSTEKLSELNTFTMRFSYIVDKIKEKNSINQSKIAEKIGLSTAALSKLKKGDSKSAAGTTLTALQSNYGVNPLWLTKHTGTPFLTETDHGSSEVFELEKNNIYLRQSGSDGEVRSSLEGWQRIVNFHRFQSRFEQVGIELVRKAMEYQGEMRKLCGLVVTFISKEKKKYDYLMLYLEGTPIQYFVIAKPMMDRSINSNSLVETFVVKGFFTGSWDSVGYDRNVEFTINLTKKQLVSFGHQSNSFVKKLTTPKYESVGVLEKLMEEKTQYNTTLTSQILDLKEDKKNLNKTIERLYQEIDELKRELEEKKKGKTSA